MATSVVGTGGKRSGSSSAIVAATASGYHILTIHGYAGTKGTPTGEYIRSHPFTAGGHRWTIRYYPNGYSSLFSDHISFYLELDESAAKAVKAQYQIRFVDQEEKRPLISEPVDSFESHTALGYPKFMKREEFEKSEHLKGGSFAVQCDIVVMGDVRVEASGCVAVPASDLHQHLGDLFRDKKGTDVVFDVGGRTFAAHRCVLAARSPVFKAELLGPMKESVAAGGGGVIRVEDMEARAFRGLLHFVYTDMYPETPKEEEGDEEEDDAMVVQHLLVAADRYGMERLKLMCEDKLCKYIDGGTVAGILTLAEQHHCHGLKKACFQFLSSTSAVNLRAVVASDGFKHLSSSCPSIMEEFVVMLGNLVP